ncbi:hypothetical protein HHL11_13965 [Ramlibacter sp. G-1-2-2]|uniref:Uncharacterized protein n=1 Tax=Ramlibacter agri TaxID=2728837 RepID=A0A848H5R4_9BURK|nr:hypothetical protein [Ramlibacter agri]NML44859.1 hypothetical protein [Ramlibacter agri]
MNWHAPAAPHPPTDAPKPANPEPATGPVDPGKGHEKNDPEQGKSEHPKQ